MSRRIRKELILEGLDCANCAAKIEAKINELSDVKTANLNFITKTLTIEISDEDKMDSVILKTKDIIKKMEPHVIVKEKIIEKVSKKVLVLMGLMCASCSSKIEERVRKINGVKNAYIDFTAGKLIIEANKRDFNRITKEAIEIIKKIEPEVDVLDESKNDKGHKEHSHSHGEGIIKKSL
ncbi:cation transporter [Caloranaerobacter azorensis]|uniref:cation transporter n=1 Tax=Caloranaerobacter azorensis TaxID=116090 RepID=UPI0024DE94F4|nr:cation transporter [Caloranaerobacter azorensis]